jgi:hypothetical protein
MGLIFQYFYGFREIVYKASEDPSIFTLWVKLHATACCPSVDSSAYNIGRHILKYSLYHVLQQKILLTKTYVHKVISALNTVVPQEPQDLLANSVICWTAADKPNPWETLSSGDQVSSATFN